MLTAR